MIVGRVRNLLKMTYPSDQYELIFVDSASDDGTIDILRDGLNKITRATRNSSTSISPPSRKHPFEEASIDDLQTALGIQQLTLFPTLRTLEGKDLIERSGETVTVAA